MLLCNIILRVPYSLAWVTWSPQTLASTIWRPPLGSKPRLDSSLRLFFTHIFCLKPGRKAIPVWALYCPLFQTTNPRSLDASCSFSLWFMVRKSVEPLWTFPSSNPSNPDPTQHISYNILAQPRLQVTQETGQKFSTRNLIQWNLY